VLPDKVNRLLQQRKTDFERSIRAFQQQTRQTILRHQSQTASLTKDFQRITELAIRDQHNRMDTLTNRLQSSTVQLTQLRLSRLENLRSTLAIYGKHRLEREQQAVAQSALQLSQRLSPFFQRETTRLETIERNLHLVDPIHVLRRGYAIVTNERGIVSAENVPDPGSEITILQSELSMISEIKSVKRYES
jgi:exodeoxyribonuclease VII large subunit